MTITELRYEQIWHEVPDAQTRIDLIYRNYGKVKESNLQNLGYEWKNIINSQCPVGLSHQEWFSFINLYRKKNKKIIQDKCKCSLPNFVRLGKKNQFELVF